MKRTILSFILITVVILGVTSAPAKAQGKPPADDFSSEVASSWFELLYDIVKSERTTPPPASRFCAHSVQHQAAGDELRESL